MQHGEAAILSVPDAMRRLPIFGGLPVPWFATWRDNHPVVSASLSKEKFDRAVTQHVCIMCGKRLRRPGAFIGEPALGIIQAGSVPPAHGECASWTLIHCGLLRLHFGEDKTPPPPKILWHTRCWGFVPSLDPPFRLGPPVAVEWYYRGRSATRGEVRAALGDAGELERLAHAWPGGVSDLRRRITRFERWLPEK